jgi:hypothetical protein
VPTAETLHRARQNGVSANQYVPQGVRPANVDRVVTMLENASETAHPGVRRAASILLERMGGRPWRVVAGPHQGGQGGAGYGADLNEHITIRIDQDTYHLQTTRDGHLRRITGDDDTDRVPPWVPPGAPIAD